MILRTQLEEPDPHSPAPGKGGSCYGNRRPACGDIRPDLLDLLQEQQEDGTIRNRVREGDKPALSSALVLTLLAVVLSLAACSKSEADIAGKHEVVPEVSPGALPALPQGIEGTTLTIANARFETEQLVLQVNQPAVLSVVNHDNRAYRLRIDQLVDGQPIAAATTTRVGFTTSKVGTYAGHLLEATNDTTLASLRVVVEAPSGATHR